MSKSFFQVLTEAINHFIENGYRSQTELNTWVKRLKEAIIKQLGSPLAAERAVNEALKSVYRRQVIQHGLLKYNAGVSAFSVNKLKPHMRRELEKRIFASANLIKLNREEAIANTLRRFEGWATSIPEGGSKSVDKKKEKESIRKSITKVSFQNRRVTIDQSQKFAASLNAVIANNNGAIAATWHSRWRTAGYDYREDHKERDEKVYAIADNWAIKQGLMKAGSDGYTQDITQPAEEVFCQCRYTYIYSLDYLPDEMLTDKGRKFLESLK